MSFKYISERDVTEVVSELEKQGIPKGQWDDALDTILSDMDYQRHSAQSSQGTLATLGKGVAVSTPSVMSQTMSGLPSYIPGEGKLDEWSRAGAEKTRGLINPYWQQDVAEAAAGPKLGKGASKTWASLVGQQLPVLASMHIGSEAGKSLGTLAGAGMGMATAGPDPTDIPLLAAARKTGGFAGGYGAMALLETGGFNEVADVLGLDRDIQESEGRNYGMVSGVFEQLQALGMLSPYTGGKAGQKVLNKSVLLPFLKTVGKEAGIAGLEGVEEVMQGAYFNKSLDRAVASQNQRNAEKGLPPVDPQAVESLKQNLREGFEAGFGVAAIIRGPGVALRGTQVRRAKLAEDFEAKVKSKGDKFFKDIEAAKSMEELAGIKKAPAPSIAAPGTTKARQEARKGLTPEQGLAMLDSLQPATMRPLAKKYGVNPDQTNDQIREELRDQIRVGELREGPVYGRLESGKMGVSVITPLINKVQEAEAMQGNKIDMGIRNMIEAADTNLEAWFPEFTETFKSETTETGEKLYKLSQDQQRNSILNALRYKALEPVIGSRKANALIPIEETSMAKPTNLSEQLTRDQYAKYSDRLRGVLRDQINSIEARNTEVKVLEGLAEETDLQADRATLISPIKYEDGTTVVPEAPTDKQGNPVELPWHRRYAGLLPSLEDIAYKINMPQLMWLDNTYMERHKLARNLHTALKTAEASRWAEIPRALRSGEPGKRMHDLVQWMGTDSTQKAKLSSTLKIPNNRQSLINRITEVSTMKDQGTVEKYADILVKDYRKLYNWFVKQGFIDPNHFHQNYMPVIYAFNKDAKKGNATLVEWITSKREQGGRVGELAKGLSQNDLDSLAKVADSLSHWKSKKFITPGKNKAMAEHARNADSAFLKQFDVITDARESYDHYVRQAIQRMVYGDMVPVTSAIALEANKVLPEKSAETFNKVFGNYLESILGVPDSGSIWLGKKKVPSFITTPIMKATNKGIETFNKSPLAEKFGKVEVKSERKDVSARDIMDVAITYMYATSLGLPANVTSPVKNLTQGPLNIAAVGVQRYLAGMVHLFQPGVMKEIMKYNLRPEMQGWEMEHMDSSQGGYAMAAQGMLSLYRMSDLINVFSSASAGLVGWKLLEARMKEGAVSHKEVTDILWRGKKGLKVDDKDVMNPDNSIKSDLWKGVVSKPVDIMINELIDQGKMEQAKKLYLQYLVNFSQWRYGPGGTPGYMRNSIIRSMFMYTSWPTNYGDYLFRSGLVPGVEGRPGMRQRYAQVAASQILLASLLSGLGYSAWRWILTGPLPKELFPIGPLAQLIESIWGILHGSAEAAIATIIPTVPDKERTKQVDHVKNQVNDLFGQ